VGGGGVLGGLWGGGGVGCGCMCFRKASEKLGKGVGAGRFGLLSVSLGSLSVGRESGGRGRWKGGGCWQ